MVEIRRIIVGPRWACERLYPSLKIACRVHFAGILQFAARAHFAGIDCDECNAGTFGEDTQSHL
ncbi:hypothetical protein BJ994_002649 [Arthrobacter pigmenti]|uniref:Uncharacterized protein n=1 Tax=Arthrobacter pigmenti TaxID=271432 RepID=A0A846RK09_9MICC|nr:hypothetical protein [Arthrobacter pigmenti]